MQPKTKTVWQVDEFGLICEVVTLSERAGDFKEGQWLIPAGCVEVEPLPEKEGFCSRWNGEAWKYAEIQLTDEVSEIEEQFIWTQERLMGKLNAELMADKAELTDAFTTAQMRNDAMLQQELRDELKELEADYKANLKLIQKGENPWEGEKNA